MLPVFNPYGTQLAATPCRRPVVGPDPAINYRYHQQNIGYQHAQFMQVGAATLPSQSPSNAIPPDPETTDTSQMTQQQRMEATMACWKEGEKIALKRQAQSMEYQWKIEREERKELFLRHWNEKERKKEETTKTTRDSATVANTTNATATPAVAPFAPTMNFASVAENRKRRLHEGDDQHPVEEFRQGFAGMKRPAMMNPLQNQDHARWMAYEQQQIRQQQQYHFMQQQQQQQQHGQQQVPVVQNQQQQQQQQQNPTMIPNSCQMMGAPSMNNIHQQQPSTSSPLVQQPMPSPMTNPASVGYHQSPSCSVDNVATPPAIAPQPLDDISNLNADNINLDAALVAMRTDTSTIKDLGNDDLFGDDELLAGPSSASSVGPLSATPVVTATSPSYQEQPACSLSQAPASNPSCAYNPPVTPTTTPSTSNGFTQNIGPPLFSSTPVSLCNGQQQPLPQQQQQQQQQVPRNGYPDPAVSYPSQMAMPQYCGYQETQMMQMAASSNHMMQPHPAMMSQQQQQQQQQQHQQYMMMRLHQQRAMHQQQQQMMAQQMAAQQQRQRAYPYPMGPMATHDPRFASGMMDPSMMVAQRPQMPPGPSPSYHAAAYPAAGQMYPQYPMN